MSTTGNIPVTTNEKYSNNITTLEQHELSQQIQFFIREKLVPPYVKWKLCILLDLLQKHLKPYLELNNELITKYGNEKGLEQYIDGKLNPKYETYKDEIKPIEESREQIEFTKIPLSSIMKAYGGGYPAVYRLFYEDANAIKIFEKQLALAAVEDVEKKPE